MLVSKKIGAYISELTFDMFDCSKDKRLSQVCTKRNLSSWQASRRELASPEEVQREGKVESWIGGYFRAGLTQSMTVVRNICGQPCSFLHIFGLVNLRHIFFNISVFVVIIWKGIFDHRE